MVEQRAKDDGNRGQHEHGDEIVCRRESRGENHEFADKQSKRWHPGDGEAAQDKGATGPRQRRSHAANALHAERAESSLNIAGGNERK